MGGWGGLITLKGEGQPRPTKEKSRTHRRGLILWGAQDFPTSKLSPKCRPQLACHAWRVFAAGIRCVLCSAKPRGSGRHPRAVAEASGDASPCRGKGLCLACPSLPAAHLPTLQATMHPGLPRARTPGVTPTGCEPLVLLCTWGAPQQQASLGSLGRSSGREAS